MSSQKIKFGDKEIDKKEFYLSKQTISLNSVDLSKIVVSIVKLLIMIVIVIARVLVMLKLKMIMKLKIFHYLDNLITS